ncbi:hypothetical protein B0H13DRAFT_2331387 [Mycena leptocephala]|nr:hypothetical protein B0H13DRAFT_2331387 [Mycena leptocephala]
MPSAATSPRGPLVFPSLHEMFPEHIAHPAAAFCHNQCVPRESVHAHAPPSPLAPGPGHQFSSFDLLHARPRELSFDDIASVRRAGSRAASDDADSVDLDADGHGRGGDAGDADCQWHGDSDKRHVCKTCGKGFNPPSSLKIHANKHSGAQPFQCPFPGCGRAFNVNSNMRRHLRAHGPASSGSRAHLPLSLLLTLPSPFTTAPVRSPISPTSLSMSPTSPRIVRRANWEPTYAPAMSRMHAGASAPGYPSPHAHAHAQYSRFGTTVFVIKVDPLAYDSAHTRGSGWDAYGNGARGALGHRIGVGVGYAGACDGFKTSARST